MRRTENQEKAAALLTGSAKSLEVGLLANSTIVREEGLIEGLIGEVMSKVIRRKNASVAFGSEATELLQFQRSSRYAANLMHWLFLLAFLFLSFTAGTGLAAAQAITGDLLGTVTDPTGAIIPGAKVSITNTDTKFERSITTNNSGDYSFTLLPPGAYVIHVESPGFKAFVENGLKLSAGDKTRIDAQLVIGDGGETVSVDASTTPVLQTDSSVVQDTVEEKQVQDLPLNGRNLESAVQATAGVNAGSPNAISGGARPDDRRPGFTFSANGQSDLANNNLVDGLDNNEREQGFSGIHPSIDAIAEVRVLTNDYSADLGRTAGAVVNIITKNGTDTFHGSAYEYFRNDVFDARDFFASGTARKAEYRQNVFGGSVGGPIIKGKTFFFADVEENRTVQGQVSVSSVPTLFEEQNPGNFSDIGGPIVPTAQINPIGLAYFQLYPTPNRSGSTLNYVSQPNKTQFATSTDDRIDHRFGDKDSIFVRFGYNPVTTVVPGPLPATQLAGTTAQPSGGFYNGPSSTTATNVQANYIHIFKPNLVLELKTGYTRINIQTNPPNHGVDFGTKLGFINSYHTPDSLGLPFMWMLAGDYTSLGDGIFIPIVDVNNTFQYDGAVTYTKSSHNVKAGGALIRRQLNYFQDQWTAAGGYAFLPEGAYTNSLANLLAGTPAFAERGADLVHQGLRSWEPSLFVNDDWHAKPWLTLNLGLRWEAYTPITEAHNRYANFDVDTLKIKIAGKDTDSRGGVATDYTDFSPRVGFAATIDPKTVLRGGFGYSYYPVESQTGIENVNPPFNYSCFPCFGYSFGTLPVPSSDATNPVGTVSTEIPNLKSGYVRQFNVFLQHEVKGNSFSLGGVGIQGRRALYLRNYDLPLPAGPSAPTPGYVYAAQLPGVNNIEYVDNSGYSNYYALQTSWVRPTSHGLTTNVNYVWAHGLSNSIQAASSTTNTYGLLTNDPNYDYGNSPIDVRHRIAGSIIYELPFAKQRHDLIGRLAGGFETAFIGFWQTGIPFTVVDSAAAINLPGVTSDRPNQIGSYQVGNRGLNHFFNTAAFATQATGTPGSERSDALYGPRQRTLNASLIKTTQLHDSLSLQFRAEFFNLTNTANFSAPGAGLGTPQFGIISSTAPNENPRQVQFALKALF